MTILSMINDLFCKTTKFITGADVCKWLRWVCLVLFILSFASCVYSIS
jgi:hypothetical protein